jgi:hypothetical protein
LKSKRNISAELGRPRFANSESSSVMVLYVSDRCFEFSQLVDRHSPKKDRAHCDNRVHNHAGDFYFALQVHYRFFLSPAANLAARSLAIFSRSRSTRA